MTDTKPTICWNCNSSYSITDAKCPSCEAHNANVNIDAANLQELNKRLERELAAIKSQPVPVEPDKVLAGAARIENQTPTNYRLARKPNGELVLQSAYQWQQGRDYGHTWRDIQTVEYGNDH